MSIFQTDTGHRFSHIEEIVEGEVLFLLLYSTELTHLFQPFIDDCRIVRESYLIHLLLTQCTQTLGFQECAYLVETNLRFEVLRVNHVAKLIILLLSDKKTP